jgi:hypothetical protein
MIFGVFNTLSWLALFIYFIFDMFDGKISAREWIFLIVIILYFPGIVTFIWNASDDNLTSRSVYKGWISFKFTM